MISEKFSFVSIICFFYPPDIMAVVQMLTYEQIVHIDSFLRQKNGHLSEVTNDCREMVALAHVHKRIKTGIVELASSEIVKQLPFGVIVRNKFCMQLIGLQLKGHGSATFISIEDSYTIISFNADRLYLFVFLDR